MLLNRSAALWGLRYTSYLAAETRQSQCSLSTSGLLTGRTTVHLWAEEAFECDLLRAIKAMVPTGQTARRLWVRIHS
jgi:hypothetical protein